MPLNYYKRVFLVVGEQVLILTCAISSGIAANKTALPVKASSTIILPPGSETMAACYVASNLPRRLTMVSSANIIEEDNIFLAPAVFCSDKARILLTNPSETLKVICKDQCLATAEPMMEYLDCTLSENQQRF